MIFSFNIQFSLALSYAFHSGLPIKERIAVFSTVQRESNRKFMVKKFCIVMLADCRKVMFEKGAELIYSDVLEPLGW